MQITRFSQATLLVETEHTRVLFDPGNLSEDEGFQLTDIDALLVTHEHADHVDQARVGGLLAANPAMRVYAPASVLDLIGIADTERGKPVVHGDRLTVGKVSIEVVGRLHQVILPSIPRCANVGFVVSGSGGERLFVPGDSYETVPENITVLALPLLGPWGSVHEAVDFMNAVAPTRFFPIHDALLSVSGQGVFWRIITQATAPGITPMQVTPGVPFSLHDPM